MEFSVSKLIDLVKNCPEIYDSSRCDFKLPEKKDSAWQTIAEALNTNEEECRRRWRTLRERYTRELKRLKKQGYSIDEPRSAFSSEISWGLFDEMSFLQGHIKLRKSRFMLERNSSNKSSSQSVAGGGGGRGGVSSGNVTNTIATSLNNTQTTTTTPSTPIRNNTKIILNIKSDSDDETKAPKKIKVTTTTTAMKVKAQTIEEQHHQQQLQQHQQQQHHQQQQQPQTVYAKFKVQSIDSTNGNDNHGTILISNDDTEYREYSVGTLDITHRNIDEEQHQEQQNKYEIDTEIATEAEYITDEPLPGGGHGSDGNIIGGNTVNCIDDGNGGVVISDGIGTTVSRGGEDGEIVMSVVEESSLSPLFIRKSYKRNHSNSYANDEELLSICSTSGGGGGVNNVNSGVIGGNGGGSGGGNSSHSRNDPSNICISNKLYKHQYIKSPPQSSQSSSHQRHQIVSTNVMAANNSGQQHQQQQNEDDFFCNSVAFSLKQMSRLHNIKAKVEIYKVLEKFTELEESA